MSVSNYPNPYLEETTFDDPAIVRDLVNGRIIAFPTETVYGLGIRWDSYDAFRSLQKLKHRTPMKTFGIMVGRHFDFEKYFFLNERSRRVISEMLPGPLTILLRPKPTVPFQAHLLTGLVGVRVPDNDQLLDFLDSLPFPLQTTSANQSGDSATNDFNIVESGKYWEEFGCFSHIVIDKTGTLGSGHPTTVVDLTGSIPMIRRIGDIGISEIKKHYYGSETAPMTVAIGCDHGGKKAALQLQQHLLNEGVSAAVLKPKGNESGDYPMYAIPAARAVARGVAERCVLICTSGEGVMICANKVKGVYCAVGYDDEVTASCVEHNFCNAISFGAGRMSIEDIIRRTDLFLGLNYNEGGIGSRHSRRVGEIKSYESRNFIKDTNLSSEYDDVDFVYGLEIE